MNLCIIHIHSYIYEIVKSRRTMSDNFSFITRDKCDTHALYVWVIILHKAVEMFLCVHGLSTHWPIQCCFHWLLLSSHRQRKQFFFATIDYKLSYAYFTSHILLGLAKGGYSPLWFLSYLSVMNITFFFLSSIVKTDYCMSYLLVFDGVFVSINPVSHVS